MNYDKIGRYLKQFAKDMKAGVLIGWIVGVFVALLYTLWWFVTSFPIIGVLCVAFLILWALGAIYNLWEDL